MSLLKNIITCNFKTQGIVVAFSKRNNMVYLLHVIKLDVYFEMASNEFVPKLTGEICIVLVEKPPRVVPPLKIRVEHAEGLSEEQVNTLGREIAETISKKLKISPSIIWAAPGSLERSHYKGQTFEKTYEGKK